MAESLTVVAAVRIVSGVGLFQCEGGEEVVMVEEFEGRGNAQVEVRQQHTADIHEGECTLSLQTYTKVSARSHRRHTRR